MLARDGAIVVSDDAIVSAVHGGIYELYSKKLKPLYKGVETSALFLATAIGRDVVVDRGLNMSRNSRARWVAIARSLDIQSQAICFKNEGPTVHAKRRYQSDSRGCTYEYWLDVTNTHNDKYEEPEYDEGFDSIITLNNWEPPFDEFGITVKER